jgi:hypothetical protein
MITCDLSHICYVKKDCGHAIPHELDKCSELSSPSSCPYQDSVCTEEE